MASVHILWLLAAAASVSSASTSTSDLWNAEPLTTSGSLKGRVAQTGRGAVAVYLGVRYARAPDRRFDPPAPHAVKDPARVVDADSLGPACQQPEHISDLMYEALTTHVRGRDVSEDCFFLNIYAPAAPPLSGPRAIMVWLPGEGFGYADPAHYDGTYLAAHGDVIVVTVTYRVGLFGFLSTGNASVPGNAGMADVLEALRWVRSNAAAFAGDPSRVTLFGRFSGAMLASLVATSPALVERNPTTYSSSPTPLVARVILQSGLATGVYVIDPDPANRTALLAEKAGCQGDHEQIMDCLRKIPAKQLQEFSGKGLDRWRPVIDGKLLTLDPLKVVRKAAYHRDMDVMIGETADEGSLCILHHFYLETIFAAQILSDNITRKEFSQLIAEHVNDYLMVTDQNIMDIATHEYKMWPDTSKSYRSQFLKFCGALYIRVKNEQFARSLVKRGSRVWRYEFAHRPSISHHPKFLGAAHGDDIIFIFGLLDRKSDPKELKISEQMMTAWTNFAKTGNPNGKQEETWPQYLENSRQMRVFSLNNTKTKSTEFLSKDIDFWGSIIPNLVRSVQRSSPQGRTCAKVFKLGKGKQCFNGRNNSTVTSLIILSIILGGTLLLISLYLFHLTRGKNTGLLSQEHITQ